jgi:hypothetical protein
MLATDTVAPLSTSRAEGDFFRTLEEVSSRAERSEGLGLCASVSEFDLTRPTDSAGMFAAVLYSEISGCCCLGLFSGLLVGLPSECTISKTSAFPIWTKLLVGDFGDFGVLGAFGDFGDLAEAFGDFGDLGDFVDLGE